MPFLDHLDDKQFEAYLGQIRPRLFRYCARMLGSVVDGEDAVQESLIKALRARSEGEPVDNPDAWLFRVAHNTCLDFLRARARSHVVPLDDTLEAELEAEPDTQIFSARFHTFRRLPELQRCAVILKDVLGHSVDEVAAIAGCTPAAAKSALQRGRAALQRLAQEPDDVRLPLMSDAEREKVSTFVRLFQAGDFDAIRSMLSEEVKVELVHRLTLEGCSGSARYFTRYAEETKWRFALGAIDGRPGMLVFDAGGNQDRPAHFVLVEWASDRIVAIRDFLFATYATEAAEYVFLR